MYQMLTEFRDVEGVMRLRKHLLPMLLDLHTFV